MFHCCSVNKENMKKIKIKQSARKACRRSVRSTLDELNWLAAMGEVEALNLEEVFKSNQDAPNFVWLTEESNDPLLNFSEESYLDDAILPEIFISLPLQDIDFSKPLISLGMKYYWLSPYVKENDVIEVVKTLPKKAIFILGKETSITIAKKAILALPPESILYLNTNHPELVLLAQNYGLPSSLSIIVGRNVSELTKMAFTKHLRRGGGAVAYDSDEKKRNHRYTFFNTTLNPAIDDVVVDKPLLSTG